MVTFRFLLPLKRVSERETPMTTKTCPSAPGTLEVTVEQRRGSPKEWPVPGESVILHLWGGGVGETVVETQVLLRDTHVESTAFSPDGIGVNIEMVLIKLECQFFCKLNPL